MPNRFEAGAELFQLLAVRPVGDIPEAVFRCFYPEVLADRVGDAFSFHLFGLAVLFDRRRTAVRLYSRKKHIIVVKLGMPDLMDHSVDSLHLAHARTDRNFLIGSAEVSVHSCFHLLKLDWNRRSSPQGFHEGVILFHITRQGADQLRQRLSLRLADIKHRNRLKHRNFYVSFLGDRLTFGIQDRPFCVRVDDGLPDFFQNRGRRDNLNAALTLFDVSLEFIPPRIEAGNKCGGGTLHVDQKRVVDGVRMESAHGRKVTLIAVALEHFPKAFFDALSDLLDLLLC